MWKIPECVSPPPKSFPSCSMLPKSHLLGKGTPTWGVHPERKRSNLSFGVCHMSAGFAIEVRGHLSIVSSSKWAKLGEQIIQYVIGLKHMYVSALQSSLWIQETLRAIGLCEVTRWPRWPWSGESAISVQTPLCRSRGNTHTALLCPSSKLQPTCAYAKVIPRLCSTARGPRKLLTCLEREEIPCG